jgi:urea carboxylase-associated protein 2
MSTSTPRGAREHARAQVQSEAARVRGKPTVPASSAVDLPPDVPRDALVWDETLELSAYAARVLERGSRIRIENLTGETCVQLLLYNADHPAERLNVADTVKVQWQAYLRAGSLLLSDMGRVLASVVRDDCARHDAFCGASSPRFAREKYGDARPSGRDRLLLAIARHGLSRIDLCPCLNLFQGVVIARDGTLALDVRSGCEGECVELRAEMRILLALANTPHVLTPGRAYAGGPVRVLAWRGAVTGESDAIRGSSPEHLRAFQNVEDYYCR